MNMFREAKEEELIKLRVVKDEEETEKILTK